MRYTDQVIEELIARYLSDVATLEERDELTQWVGQSADNKVRYQQLRNIWQAAHPAFDPKTIDTGRALKSVTRRLSGRTVWYQSAWMLYWQRVAAVLLLPLFLFSGYLYLENERKVMMAQTAIQEIFAPYGTRSKVNLPDGSTVWLNAGSSLKYPVAFSAGRRDVKLCGEGYFDVKSDASRPFIVHTQKLHVRATGTAFNVEAYEPDSMVAVTMVQGKIDVIIGKQQPISLRPGERIGYNAVSLACQIIKTDPYKWCAWKEGAIVFRDDPLEFVFKRIGQTFNVELVLKSKEIANHPYRATFENESLDEILALLKLTAPIRYKEFERTVAVDNRYQRKRIEIYSAKP
ncbi:MAG: FecR domain-containing protein [Tannerellaceae bacterium]